MTHNENHDNDSVSSILKETNDRDRELFTRTYHKQKISKNDRIKTLLASFVLGMTASVIHFLINQPVHNFHQQYTIAVSAFLSFCIIIPLMEEVTKRIGLTLVHYNTNSNLYSTTSIVLIGYGFQTMEAFFFWFSFNEAQVWVRLILPLHVLFILITTRYGLFWGAFAHGIWNFQLFMPQSDLIQMAFMLVSYLVLGLVLNKERDRKLEEEAAERIINKYHMRRNTFQL